MFSNIVVLERRARGRPARALELTVSGKCFTGGRTRFGLLLGISGECFYGDRVLTSCVAARQMHFTSERAVMEDSRDLGGTIVVPLTDAAIAFLEEVRQGGDVELRFRLRVDWQEADLKSPDNPSAGYAAGLVHWNEKTFAHSISQSDWLKLLTQMEWEEWRLFELPAQPLVLDPHLSECVRHLGEAQKLLRQGDFDGSLAECRRGFESAAQHHVPGDSRRGFELLLSRAFARTVDRPKSQLLQPVMESLNGYIHPLGRHAQAPALHVTRAEAEFVLATSVALLSMLSRGIKDSEQ